LDPCSFYLRFSKFRKIRSFRGWKNGLRGLLEAVRLGHDRIAIKRNINSICQSVLDQNSKERFLKEQSRLPDGNFFLHLETYLTFNKLFFTYFCFYLIINFSKALIFFIFLFSVWTRGHLFKTERLFSLTSVNIWQLTCVEVGAKKAYLENQNKIYICYFC